MDFSNEFLQKTIEVWQPHSPARLTTEDAREICKTLINLHNFMLELELKYSKKAPPEALP
jgi:hypothetical protein